MQPLFVIAIDHKSVVTAPSHVVQGGAGFNNLHPPRRSLDIANSRSPRKWFIDFHVVEFLVQPTQDILVHQPISHPQGVCFAGDRTPSTPFRSGRCGKGCTWQGLLSLHLLPWYRGHRRRRKRGPPPNHMTRPLFSSLSYPLERPKEGSKRGPIPRHGTWLGLGGWRSRPPQRPRLGTTFEIVTCRC